MQGYTAGTQQERLTVVAEGRPPVHHWIWMWAGNMGIHCLCRWVCKPMLRAVAGLRSKLCLQSWQLLGKGKSEGGLGAGNVGTVRQSAARNQPHGRVRTMRRSRLGSAFSLSHLQPSPNVVVFSWSPQYQSGKKCDPSCLLTQLLLGFWLAHSSRKGLMSAVSSGVWGRSNSSLTTEAFVLPYVIQGTPTRWWRRKNEHSHCRLGNYFTHRCLSCKWWIRELVS